MMAEEVSRWILSCSMPIARIHQREEPSCCSTLASNFGSFVGEPLLSDSLCTIGELLSSWREAVKMSSE